jgi:two-component system OmpR family sensor kinase
LTVSAEPEQRSRWLRPLGGTRTRVLSAYLILLVFSSLVSLVALRQILIARAGERVDNSLVQETAEFRRLAQDGRDPRTGRPFGRDAKAIFDVFLARNVPGEGEGFITFVGSRPYRASASGRLRTPEIDRFAEIGAVRKTTEGEVMLSDGSRVRYIAVPVLADGARLGVFGVTIDLSGELREVNQALRVAAAVFFGVLLLASVLAWVVVGRVLAPLRLLRDTARSVSESALTRRIPVRGNDELADLARSFNAMLDRLEAAIASQKAFISDAGHELRTPITIIRGHLELLGDDPDERRETVDLVTDELDRMSRFVDDLLLLAKAQRPDFLRLEELDLDLLVREVFAKASALGPRDWRLERAGAGRLLADRQRLTQAMINLSENAAQHTTEKDSIALGAEASNGVARLWVRDSGSGIPVQEQDHIFERFAQGGSPGGHRDGAGLGLAIVRAIAVAHGGRVEVASQVGQGSTFTVVIPTEPPEATRT